MEFQAQVEAALLEVQQVQPKSQDSKVAVPALQDMELQVLMELELRELELMEREQLEQVLQVQDSVQLMELEVSGQTMELDQLHTKVAEGLEVPTCQAHQELQELRVHLQPTQLQEAVTRSSVKDTEETRAATAAKVLATISPESNEKPGFDFTIFIYYNRFEYHPILKSNVAFTS